MFCYQCQEASRGIGCTILGVCGKNENVAKLLDFLVYTVGKISSAVIENKLNINHISNVNRAVIESLFMSITNVNFDEEDIFNQIKKNILIENEIKRNSEHEFGNLTKEEILKIADEVGVLNEINEDIRSVKQMIVYGIKGMAAYVSHAFVLGCEDYEIYKFIYESFYKISNCEMTLDDLINLVFETGKFGIRAMEILDNANTSRYGHPEITEINIGTRNRPGILVSGHDLRDMEDLLDQIEGEDIDVYTHGEMLPVHTYPYFKKYKNLYGNYGGAWHRQLDNFGTFKGPILFTTNCIVPPQNEEIKNRIFTTGSVRYPGCKHINTTKDGRKDFSEVINMAKECSPPIEIESGNIVGGFAHRQVKQLMDKLIENIKSGNIKEFVVMAGCDGRMKSREYYTEKAKSLPKDSIILTAGCAKYRYNKLDLGNVNGIPRILDSGQCNDSYSIVRIAMELQKQFKLEDINDLPIQYDIAWYEQKAVIVLLSLLYLGVKNIKLGPTLPAFLSPNVKNFLIERFMVSTI